MKRYTSLYNGVHLGVAGVLVLLAAALAAAQSTPEQISVHLERAETAQKQGLQTAVREFRKVIELQPSDAQSHGRLGMVYRRLGMLPEAIGSLETALRLDPNLPRLKILLGFSYQEAGRCPEAIPPLAESYEQEAEKPAYKTSYRIINVHHHWDAPSPEAVEAQIEVMDRAGIAAAVNLDGGRTDGTLPAWLELQKKHPARFVTFAKFTKKDFERIGEPRFFQELVGEVERAAKMGIRGVKIWKDLGMLIQDGTGKLLRLDDPRLDLFWAKCGELGIPVFIHTADPKEYWNPLGYNSLHYGARTEEQQYYKIPGMPRWEELIAQRDNVVQKHSKTTFIGAHFGSMTFDLQGLAERLDRYPNFHVECAARLRILGRLSPKAVRDFFVKYQDRILFGTDGGVLLSGRKSGPGPKNILVYPADDPDWVRIDPKDEAAARRWKDGQVRFYSRHFEYLETDRPDLPEPGGFGAEWLRLAGVKLPPEVLEKFYHANAERLIPGMAEKK